MKMAKLIFWSQSAITPTIMTLFAIIPPIILILYIASVGSPQVSFLMCTLEIPQKNCSTSSLLLTLFTFTFEPFLKL